MTEIAVEPASMGRQEGKGEEGNEGRSWGWVGGCEQTNAVFDEFFDSVVGSLNNLPCLGKNEKLKKKNEQTNKEAHLLQFC